MSSEVFNMDCMEGMKQYPDKYFDLAVVDPPYGIEKEISIGGKESSKSTVNFHNRYKSGSLWDKKPTAEYFKELMRVSENQIICGGNYFPELWMNPVRGFVFWYKQTPVPNFSDGELIWTSFKRPAKFFQHRYTNILDGNNKRLNIPHPTAKPISLYSWIYDNYLYCKSCKNMGSYYEDVVGDGGSQMLMGCDNCALGEGRNYRVLDTHLGSGSNRIAADKAGNIDFIGYELDKDYYEAQEKRFKDYKLQLNLFQ